MKIYSLIPAFIVLTLTANKCKDNDPALKGRLEVKGMCMNYTIKLVEGKLDTSLYISEWKDETTGTIHRNVFA